MIENKKRQILFIVSLIGIVLVSLMLVTTYAYQSVQVDYKDGSDNDMTLNVGKLNVQFTTSRRLNIENLPFLPDYKTADYTEFTLTNVDSTSEIAYVLSLTNLEYDSELAISDFKYTITLVNSDNTENIIGSGDFSNLTGNTFDLYFDSGLYRNLLNTKTETLRLYIWLKETDAQIDIAGKSFKGYITITSLFANEIDNPIANVLLEKAQKNTDADLTTYSETPLTSPGNAISGIDESVMSVAEDDLVSPSTYSLSSTTSYSYYYRGNVIDNYLNFNGMCWRIVRIAGDNSIKLILEDQDEECSTSMNSNWKIGLGVYGYTFSNEIYKINYLDYNGGMATAFKNFQTSKLNDVTKYLKSGDWCMGDAAYSKSNADVTTATPLTDTEKETYYNNKTVFYYDSYVRLYGNSLRIPTFKCNGNYMSTFSDGTSMYVGALTADEAVFAGGVIGKQNYNYYIINNSNTNYFWLLSPYRNWYGNDETLVLNRNAYGFNYDDLTSLYVYYNHAGGAPTDNELYGTGISGDIFYRPAISLKSGIQILTGSGTINNPYEVKID